MNASGQGGSSYPPPVLSSRRVLSWARTDPPAVFTGRLHAYRGDKRIGQLPILVIAQMLNPPEAIGIIHCDEGFEDEGTTGDYGSIEEAKEDVKRYYEGLEDRWIDLNTTVQEAEDYLRKEYPEQVCSHCGRLPHQWDQLIGDERAAICNHCVEQFAAIMADESDSESGSAS